MGVDDIDDFGSLAALGNSDSVSPFFARANQASTTASSQLISPRSSSSFSKLKPQPLEQTYPRPFVESSLTRTRRGKAFW